jgi:CheY-like chemotaxis protein
MKILLVEDESSCRIATSMLLQYLGHSVDAAASGEEALARFDRGLHQLVVTDLVMPGLSGQDVAAEIKRKSSSTPVVMYTGTAVTNLEWVDALITKPASIADFRETLSMLSKSSPSNSGGEPHDLAQRPRCPERVRASTSTRPQPLHRSRQPSCRPLRRQQPH